MMNHLLNTEKSAVSLETNQDSFTIHMANESGYACQEFEFELYDELYECLVNKDFEQLKKLVNDMDEDVREDLYNLMLSKFKIVNIIHELEELQLMVVKINFLKTLCEDFLN